MSGQVEFLSPGLDPDKAQQNVFEKVNFKKKSTDNTRR